MPGRGTRKYILGEMHNANEMQAANLVARATEVLQTEADAVVALKARIGGAFVDACRLILECRGRVVVSGIGKSGHIARKMAATFASTGTPAFFVHPAEASHGDLGMVTRDDVFVAISYSGSTEELTRIVPLLKRQGARLISMTGDDGSRLATLADVHLDASIEREACPMNLAPTASTTAALALGDALAVAVLDARGFGPSDFARSHPGGALGRRLLTRVADVMRTGAEIPSVPAGSSLVEAILEVTRKRMGMTAVVTPDDRLCGIFTDGDLRRILEADRDLRDLSIDDVMSRKPITIDAEALAVEAVRLMEDRRISQVLILDAQSRVIGATSLLDMLSAKVV